MNKITSKSSMSSESEKKIVIAYHSESGHTEVIAKSIAKGISAVADCHAIFFNVVNEDVDWDILNSADGVVFGCPTYMGNVSGVFKTFMDASSAIWFSRGWVNKVAGGFTCSGSLSGDKLNTLQALSLYALQHGMVWLGPEDICTEFDAQPHNTNRLGSHLGLMAQCNPYSDTAISPPEGDRETARLFGMRIANAVIRWSIDKVSVERKTIELASDLA